MEYRKSIDLIRQLQAAKAANKELTFKMIENKLKDIKKPVSESTIKRVFGKDAEENANSFSYENTLIPIAEVVLNYEDVPVLPDTPHSNEIESNKATIRLLTEEINRLNEIKGHLDIRVGFLIDQIKIKDRRIDERKATQDMLLNALVEKDKMIKDLTDETKRLEETIRQLMGKCINCRKE